jgi:hypothetical protein
MERLLEEELYSRGKKEGRSKRVDESSRKISSSCGGDDR